MLTMLAPMAGYTDRAMRDLCRSYDADVVYTEMINAYTVMRTPEKAMQLLGIDGELHPIAAQLFGSDPDMLAQAAQRLESWGVDHIDLNAGCPVKKVVSIGAGASLLTDLPLFTTCVQALRKAITTARFSVKIRAGWNDRHLVHTEIGKIVSDIGIDHITIHARTRDDGFSGVPNLDYITELKQSSTVPVIGNGNIMSRSDAEDMVNQTGCDGVMIGRGAIGRPWLFTEIKEQKDLQPDMQAVINMVLTLYHEKARLYSEKTAVVEMRKTLPFFIRGWDHAKQIRVAVNKTVTIKDVEEVLTCGHVC